MKTLFDPLRGVVLRLLAFFFVHLALYATPTRACDAALPVMTHARFVQATPRGDAMAAGNDVVIGGVFDVHEETASRQFLCGGNVNPQSVQRLEAFLWAVDTVKTRYESEPLFVNLTFSPFALDSCSDSDHMISLLSNFEGCQMQFKEQRLGPSAPFVDPVRTLAYVGFPDDDSSVRASNFLNKFHKPVISVGATANSINNNNNDKFANVVTMMPSDDEQAHLLVELLKSIRDPSSSSSSSSSSKWWSYVHLIVSDDLHGQSSMKSFIYHATEEGVRIATTQVASADATEDDLDLTMDKLRTRPGARAVVVLAKQDVAPPGNTGDGFCTRLLAASHRARVGREFTFVFGSGCGHLNFVALRGTLRSEALGSLGLVYSNLPQLEFLSYFRSLRPKEKDSRNPWFAQFWEQTFDCRLIGFPHPKNHSGLNPTRTNPCDVDNQYLTPQRFRQDPFVPSIIAAVDRAVFAIADAIRRQCRGVASGLCPEALRRQEELKELVRSALKADESGAAQRRQRRQLQRQHEGSASARMSARRTESTVTDYLKVVNFQLSNNKHEVVEVARFHNHSIEWNPQSSLQLFDSNGSPKAFLPSECVDPLECDWLKEGSSRGSMSTTDSKMESFEELLKHNLVGGTVKLAGIELRGELWVLVLVGMTSLGLISVLCIEAYLLCRVIRAPSCCSCLSSSPSTTSLFSYYSSSPSPSCCGSTLGLGQALLCGVALIFAVNFALLLLPSIETCLAFEFGYAAGQVVCFAIIIVKLVIIISWKRSSASFLSPIFQSLLFFFAVAIQIVITVMRFVYTAKPILDSDPQVKTSNAHLWSWMPPSSSSISSPGSICHLNFEEFLTAHSYVMFLILLSFILSIYASKIEYNNHESVYIASASGLSILCWACLIGGGLASGNSRVQEALMGYALLAEGIALLAVMVLPKLCRLSAIMSASSSSSSSFSSKMAEKYYGVGANGRAGLQFDNIPSIYGRVHGDYSSSGVGICGAATTAAAAEKTTSLTFRPPAATSSSAYDEPWDSSTLCPSTLLYKTRSLSQLDDDQRPTQRRRLHHELISQRQQRLQERDYKLQREQQQLQRGGHWPTLPADSGCARQRISVFSDASVSKSLSRQNLLVILGGGGGGGGGQRAEWRDDYAELPSRQQGGSCSMGDRDSLYTSPIIERLETSPPSPSLNHPHSDPRYSPRESDHPSSHPRPPLDPADLNPHRPDEDDSYYCSLHRRDPLPQRRWQRGGRGLTTSTTQLIS